MVLSAVVSPRAIPSLPAHEKEHEAAPSVAGWTARLACRFARVGQRTALAERMHAGPLLVQRPFYPEGPETCHLYLIHPPGGVAGGDSLVLDATLEAGAAALITTPAATKVYRSALKASYVESHFHVADGALLEWLPQETLVFNNARAQLSTRIDLCGSARFIGWEVIGLGRPASGEKFKRGSLRQRFEVYRDGEPVFLERSMLEGGDAVLDHPWGLSGQPVFATMVLTCDSPASCVEQVRETMHVDAPGQFAITALSGVVVCRYIGPWAEAARTYLGEVWRILRPTVMDKRAAMPRIWAT